MFWVGRRLLAGGCMYFVFSFMAWVAVFITLLPVLFIRGPAGIALEGIWLALGILVVSALVSRHRKVRRSAINTARLRAMTEALQQETALRPPKGRHAAPPVPDTLPVLLPPDDGLRHF